VSDDVRAEIRELCAQVDGIEARHTIARLTAENKRLRDALLRLMLPYQALLLDTPSRRWICPDIWNNIETAMKEAWKVLKPERR
jgi:hypothetical protein